jgi:hypothetical protein
MKVEFRKSWICFIDAVSAFCIYESLYGAAKDDVVRGWKLGPL